MTGYLSASRLSARFNTLEVSVIAAKVLPELVVARRALGAGQSTVPERLAAAFAACFFSGRIRVALVMGSIWAILCVSQSKRHLVTPF